METYLTHLLEDLHAITLARWRRCPPHFYQAGMRDDLHQPPEGFLEKPQPDALPGETEACHRRNRKLAAQQARHYHVRPLWA